MYERKYQPLATKRVYYKRLWKNFLYMDLILFSCLAVGILGYHYTANIPWLDSLHNASMILAGMGPVAEVTTTGGKWFSSFYALFSGVAFITNISVFMAPAVHRFFHKFHLEEK
ncbi:MAG TPA: hypothetical protein PLP23_04275 [Panacibacter sp.]|nr:hypothetical protein [Panacibacter sp.]